VQREVFGRRSRFAYAGSKGTHLLAAGRSRASGHLATEPRYSCRSNWVFFGSDQGGNTAAVLVASCQRVGLDLFAWADPAPF
jgi:hypothetical protein